MDRIFALLSLQGAMGAFDAIYHHEITERLAWRPGSARELQIHAVRNLFYAALFLAFGWGEWHGLWAFVLAGMMATEILVTLTDFVIEDRTRDLPASERVTHTLLAINFGIILAVLAPELLRWAALPTGVLWVSHGAWSALASAIGVGALVDAVRDGGRGQAMARRAARVGAALSTALPGRLSILITGGTGFIGSRLAEALAETGHAVTVLTRDVRKGRKFRGRVTLIENLHTLGRDTPFDAIVNLAGEPVADRRWTAARKRKILESRLRTTEAVLRFIAKARRKPAVLVSASAIGFYGTDPETGFVEDTAARPCFGHEICDAWERTAMGAARHGVRVVTLRIGLVLGAGGGMLAKLLIPYELGLGGPIGSGRQWMSWIHFDDLVGLILHAIAVENLSGPMNGTAPEPVRNRDFARALGRALHRPAFLPVPAFAARLLLGREAADDLLLGGQRVLPRLAEETGYQFLYPTLPEALREIVG
ncbi:MAG TPA: TIGR01777 family oxidoreductase [Stellaceae bacterium]|nr:TIGR01777 family oxidoreductase [Stellaceae bacterium]